jgi:DNA-directed RNA polymerase specialized sigma24 family protein
MNVHKLEDLFNAFENLPLRDHKRMKYFVLQYVDGTPYEDGDDLIHEVIYRHAEENRHWPVGVDLVTYIVNCARSIAYSSRRHHSRKNISLNSMLDSGEEASADEPRGAKHSRPVGSLPSAEDIAIEHERLRHCLATVETIGDLLKDDPLATKVLKGILEDMTPAEMRNDFQERESSIKAARQRVHKTAVQLRNRDALRSTGDLPKANSKGMGK